ncbi:terpene synthase-like isoform X1 [Artemia franciscana]|uniref:Geranylgeranyl pyrophosphate synthase n=1 Tax=Artemia franciscana TaxID=6661 RepID=A0AA88IAA0_ARTSF|nr:hypothetical protein QYM36_006490 [Artemia franciscana]
MNCKDKEEAYSNDIDRKFDQYDKLLLQPFHHICQIPGKKVRAKLTVSFNNWLKIPEDNVKAISEIIQLLHNASLLLDDIEDASTLRRGLPVAHAIYGMPSTINCANYVCFIALQKVLALGKSEATKVYCEQMLELHRGQGMEIYWRDSFSCPSEEEYKEIIVRKTGGLFNMAVRMMQLFSDNKEDFTKLSSILGLYFQIRDDYENLKSFTYAENKSFCEDLTEGKFSFPIIHAIRTQPDDNQVINILRQRTTNPEVKLYCVNLLEKFGSLEYTRKTMMGLDDSARCEIKRLGGNPDLQKLLDELKTW